MDPILNGNHPPVIEIRHGPCGHEERAGPASTEVGEKGPEIFLDLRICIVHIIDDDQTW